MSDVSTVPEPVSESARRLRQVLAPHVWEERVGKAIERACIVTAVLDGARRGVPKLRTLGEVSPETPWPTFQYWEKRALAFGSTSWEAFLDQRNPPKQFKIPEAVRAAAVSFRLARPDLTCEEARRLLVRQHGTHGDISDASLFRIWQAAGLSDVEVEDQQEDDELEAFHGGAGLALIGAAAAETGTMLALATAIKAEAEETAATFAAESHAQEKPGRDARGRLTRAYNEAIREGVQPGHPDGRWAPDHQKRAERDLSRLQLLEHGIHTIADKALAVAVTPLLTERRGFGGLEAQRGLWLGALGGHAYMPATLDKFLAQLGLLDVEDALWTTHAAVTQAKVSQWAAASGAAPWLSVVLYVDSTQEPHWTASFAKSGKISRTGRIAPCLTRIAVNSGPGQPMLVETFSGTATLKKELPRVLDRVDDCIGKGELARLVVMDAEMATAAILSALGADATRDFVTVLKGASVPKKFVSTGDWEAYREKDQLREGTFVLTGKGAPKEGLPLRVVEMRRDGRNPHSTYFATSCTVDKMSTTEVADAYLSRWPNQEALFRNARNGLGLGLTHGYSGEWVQNISLDTHLEKVRRQVARAGKHYEDAERHRATAEALAETTKSQKKKAALLELAEAARQEASRAGRALKQARQDLAKTEGLPRLIFERDTARENVVTALRMHLFFLIEFVLREFFGGLSIELRTFVEAFVSMPVTVVTSDQAITYQVEADPRFAARNKLMAQACKAVNDRKIHRGSRLLVFEMVAPQKPVRRTPMRVG